MTRPSTPSGSSSKILTIPNLLSALRLCMIPVFAWLYCAKDDPFGAGIVLAASGITDMLDGFIARTFHMVSDVGKVLDPIADKLTQAVMLICLLTRFPLMIIPFVLLICKELFMGITGLLVIRRTGAVFGADWHGKVNTVLLYAVMILHLFWPDLPAGVSGGLIGACVVMMLISLALYGLHHIRVLKGKR